MKLRFGVTGDEVKTVTQYTFGCAGSRTSGLPHEPWDICVLPCPIPAFQVLVCGVHMWVGLLVHVWVGLLVHVKARC